MGAIAYLLVDCTLCVLSEESLSMFSSVPTALVFMFSSIIHLQLIFVGGAKEGLRFIFIFAYAIH